MKYFRRRVFNAFVFIFLIGVTTEISLGSDLGFSAIVTKKIAIPVSNSETVEATLRLPASRSRKKLPAFMIFGGFESAGKVLDLIHPDRPAILASFDYPFSGSRVLGFKDGLSVARQAKSLFPKTVRGIVELAKLLRERTEVDPHKIVAVGASFGTPFVLAAAARSSDITHIAIAHGFGRIPDTAEHVLLRSWRPKYGWVSRPMAWLLSRTGWWYLSIEEPESDARKLNSGQSVLMITAADDSFIPRACSDSLWDAIEESKGPHLRLIWPGDHLMPGSDGLVRKMMLKIEAWVGH